jgi:thiamine-phosphate pyrophosphorylase
MEAIAYARARDVKIIVNDRVDIALATCADGVHLGQDDLPPSEARDLLGPDAIIGFSTHSVEQAKAALDLPVDYVAIGPVFSTSTKDDPDPVVGLEGLRAVRSELDSFPLVAIGGIDRSNAGSVLDAGAQSLAIISALITEPGEITARMRSFSAT